MLSATLSVKAAWSTVDPTSRPLTNGTGVGLASLPPIPLPLTPPLPLPPLRVPVPTG